MPKLTASTRVRSLVASPWFLVVILVSTIILILMSVSRDSPTSAVTLPAASNAQGTGFTYAAHFPGVFGLLALQKLINFQDELFKATMTMYKHKAMEVCSDLYRTRDQCVEAVDKRRPPEPVGFELYDLFNAYITCPAGKKLMKRIGDAGDGGKWVCIDILQEEDCVIFSLGSNGQYDLERDLLKRTNCRIFTFDCTYDGVSQDRQRHKYIKKCIGTQEKEGADKRFITLANAMRELKVERVDLLKVDIEGYEFDELSSWSITDSLPVQISIEVHHSSVIYTGGNENETSHYKVQDFSNLLWPVHHLDLSDLALFFGHISRLGYAIASREDNPQGNCCSEFLLLRAVDWVPL